MADTTEVAAAPTASPAKVKKPRAKKGEGKPKKPSTHPPVNDMVVAAIKTLKERNGSSLQAIKKYISANYKCDAAKLAPFIKKALKTGVEKGTFAQTKGTGASGSFKLKDAKKAEKKPKKAAGEKKAKKTGEKKKKVATKKPAGEKKSAAKKPKAAKKSGEKKAKAAPAKAAKKAAAPKQKSTKPSKTAAKKPKTPKPKKAAPAKKAAKK